MCLGPCIYTTNLRKSKKPTPLVPSLSDSSKGSNLSISNYLDFKFFCTPDNGELMTESGGLRSGNKDEKVDEPHGKKGKGR